MTRADLERRVEALVERSAIASFERADFEILGETRPVEGRWHARIVLRHGDTVLGARELIGEDRCESLNQTVAVVVATLLDLLRHPPVVPERETASPFSLSALGRAVLGMQRTPIWSAGANAALALSSALELSIDLQMSTARRISANDAGRGASFQNFDVGIALCPRLFAWGRAGLFGCAGALAGVARAHGFGFDSSSDADRFSAVATLEIALRVQLFSHAALQLGVGPLLALARPRFYYQDQTGVQRELERTRPFGMQLRLGFIVNEL